MVPMTIRTPSSRLALAAFASLLAFTTFARADDAPTYEREIRPLFAKRCTVCHNARKLDNPDISGGLALDAYEAVLRGTKEQKVVTLGNSSSSELYRRVGANDEDERMPLNEKPLDPAQQDLIRRWIDAGAPRGTPTVSMASPTPKASPRRRPPALDVVLPLDLQAPKGIDGLGPGGKVEIVARLGPLPAITALAFRGDGRLLAVGTYGQVTVWDLADARPAVTLNEIPGPVHALAFSNDGRRLAVGAGLPAETGSVRLYTVPDGTLVLDFEGHTDVVYALAFRPDGAQLASAGFDQTVRLWDLTEGKPAGSFHGHSDFVYEVVYTPNGRMLLSASKDRSVKRIDARSLRGLRTYSDHNDDVLALALRPDGSGFVSAGNEPQLRWWTLEGEKPTKRVGGHSGPVHQLSFSANGRRLISASGDQTVRIWDGATGLPERTLSGLTDWQYTAALSPDAHLAAAGGWDGLVHLWNADNGQLLATFVQSPGPSPGSAEWLAVTPAGYVSASSELLEQVRWRIGGVELAPGKMRALSYQPAHVAQAIQGQAVPPIFEKP
jgi:hypothetical protein